MKLISIESTSASFAMLSIYLDPDEGTRQEDAPNS
jgi:hypothetical protein